MKSNTEFIENKSKWSQIKEKILQNKCVQISLMILKPIVIILCLYVFVISLELMTSSFRLIAGTKAADLFDKEIIGNPLAGLMIGVLVTVIVQSSSTSTSIVVSMVAAKIIDVRPAIPIIMGANIGTSVTSTLVAFGQVADKDKFKLSFAGATVHDMFNILSVIILLPLESASGYLFHFTEYIVGNSNTTKINDVDFLKAITDPVTKLIVQLDKKKLENIAINKTCCEDGLLKRCNFTKCGYLFESVDLEEVYIGVILLLFSLVALCICLILMVKILSSLFKGSIAKYLENKINSDFPGQLRHLTGYFFILIGCILTVLVQSSSVFTSSLIPLVGVGVVKLERIFPLTLGSNLGTTITGIIAALASGSNLSLSLQIALCHTFFNLSGILIWYPIPHLRNVPLFLARKLGEISAVYRWFALVYLFGVFFVTPLAIFGLSQAGDIAFWIVMGLVLLILFFVIVVNILQNYFPRQLPLVLQNWNFLPLPLRSLEPYDKILRKTICRCKKFNQIDPVIKPEDEIKEIFIEKNDYLMTQIKKF